MEIITELGHKEWQWLSSQVIQALNWEKRNLFFCPCSHEYIIIFFSNETDSLKGYVSESYCQVTAVLLQTWMQISGPYQAGGGGKSWISISYTLAEGIKSLGEEVGKARWLYRAAFRFLYD